MTEIISTTYKDFNKIEQIADLCQNELQNVNWHELKDYLITQPKDDKSNDGPSWMLQQSNKITGLHSYEDSLSIKEVMSDEVQENLGTWLCLTFLDKQWNKQTNNPKVVDIFKKTINYINNLQEVVHVSVHFLSSKFFIIKHTDAVGIYSMLITFNISKNNPENVILYMSNGDTYNFKDRKFFTFVPEIEHSAVNESDNDWVFMMIRINQTAFTNENINT